MRGLAGVTILGDGSTVLILISIRCERRGRGVSVSPARASQAASPGFGSFSERGLTRAAESLARLLGYPVRFTGPQIQRSRSSALPDLADAAAGSLAALRIAIHGQGAVGSHPAAVAHRVPLPAGPDGNSRGASLDLTATERSAIQEVGNIVASSFLSELGDQVGRRFSLGAGMLSDRCSRGGPRRARVRAPPRLGRVGGAGGPGGWRGAHPGPDSSSCRTSAPGSPLARGAASG
ncbi:MAG: chemotaxis protein CheC [Candidatus Moduliflexus flocculans]|nr:chemotaxis protein CheC [Candidatus Moduliflexus flocculans]